MIPVTEEINSQEPESNFQKDISYSQPEDMEQLNYKNIHHLLDKYREYNNLKGVSESFLNNNSIFSEESQLPDLILKRENPYFDKNQSFFVTRSRANSYFTNKKILKVIYKEYQPNYVMQKQKGPSKNSIITSKDGSESYDSLSLGVIRESFNILTEVNNKGVNNANLENSKEYIPKYSADYYQLLNDFCNSRNSDLEMNLNQNVENSFKNVNLEIELNYELLNQESKWLFVIFHPERNQKVIGPLGTGEVYLLLRTKNKDPLMKNSVVFVIDLDNEVYLEYIWAYIVISEEIMKIIRDYEEFGFFYRHAIQSHNEHPVTRILMKEKVKNKFDTIMTRRIIRKHI